MSRPDNITLANKKNRVGKSRLQTELNRINREQLIDMRMHNNAKQRFKSKYAKLDVFDDNKGSEDLHMLLFTNGEVDIDKLLCLYLLTAHKTETLTPPPKSQRTSFLAREQSPLERLVDRSKRRTFDGRLLKILPLYILELHPSRNKDQIRDQRLFSKLIINDKILQIVDSVKKALEISNPEIIGRFLATAKNREQIQMVMAKPKMQDYFKSLHGQNIISSCESFHLETLQRDNVVPFQVGIEALEDLVRSIRRNILQMPNTDSWKLFYKSISSEDISSNSLNRDKEDKEDEGRMIFVNPQEEIASTSGVVIAKTASVEEMVKIDEVDEVGTAEFRLEYDDSSDTIGSIRTVPPVQPKILKNLQMGFSEAKYDQDAQSPKAKKMEKLNFDKLANLLSQKVRKESLKDYNKMMTEQPAKIEESSEDVVTVMQPPRIVLKQTTCEACMNKWKSPLPSPKTSKLKKVPLPMLKDTSYFSSRSAQRISELIDEEVKRFEVYDKGTKTEAVQLSNRAYKKLAKGSYIMGSSVEIIDLDELELAKIRQEIKETETQKKYTKFMNKLGTPNK